MVDPTTLNDYELIEFLRNTPAEKLTDAERLKIKDMRPTPFLTLVERKCWSNCTYNRTFQMSWYEKFPWLTACDLKNKMFCYPCLLFGVKVTDWCSEGYEDYSNVMRSASKHQVTAHHIRSRESWLLLGKTPLQRSLAAAAPKHNEAVIANRQVLRRIVQGLIFLCHQELPLCNPDNSTPGGNFEQLILLLAQNELLVRQHLESSPLFKDALGAIQDDLLVVLSDVLTNKIKSEILETPFVSIQVDDVADLTFRSQISVIFRYCVDGAPQERFAGLYDFPDPLSRTASHTSKIIQKILDDWGVALDKLVAQTYDGSIMIGNAKKGLQHCVQKFCPKALFIHCHAHPLSTVLLQGTKDLPHVRSFVRGLTTLQSFFDPTSKRFEMLAKKFVKNCLWDFETKAVLTMLDNFNDIKEVCEAVTRGQFWDADTLTGAAEVMRYLDDPSFVFLACVFEQCFYTLEPMGRSFKQISAQYEVIKEVVLHLERLKTNPNLVEVCVKKSSELNESLSFSMTAKKALGLQAKDVISAVVKQLKARFEDFPKTAFVELLDHSAFGKHRKKFPVLTLNKLVALYPFFQSTQLQNELSNVHSDPRKTLPPRELLQYLFFNEIDCVYEEVTKLIKLILTLPSFPVDNEGINLEEPSTDSSDPLALPLLVPVDKGKAVKRTGSTSTGSARKKSRREASVLLIPSNEETSESSCFENSNAVFGVSSTTTCVENNLLTSSAKTKSDEYSTLDSENKELPESVSSALLSAENESVVSDPSSLSSTPISEFKELFGSITSAQLSSKNETVANDPPIPIKIEISEPTSISSFAFSEDETVGDLPQTSISETVGETIKQSDEQTSSESPFASIFIKVEQGEVANASSFETSCQSELTMDLPSAPISRSKRQSSKKASNKVMNVTPTPDRTRDDIPSSSRSFYVMKLDNRKKLVANVPPVVPVSRDTSKSGPSFSPCGGSELGASSPSELVHGSSTSTLLRVRSYLKKCIKDSRLSCWGALAIERKFLSDLSANPVFMDRVIDLYAERKGYEFDFIPKKF